MSDGRTQAVSPSALYSRDAIINMSQAEYRELDIGKFVMYNLARYTSPCIRVHQQVYSTYEPTEIANHLYVYAFPAVKQKHEQNLDAVGELRTKILFSTLKHTCNAIAPKKLGTIYGMRFETRRGKAYREAMAPEDDESPTPSVIGGTLSDEDVRLAEVHLACASGGDVVGEFITDDVGLPASECDAVSIEPGAEHAMRQRSEEHNTHLINAFITTLRGKHISPRDARILELSIFDGFSNRQIAEVVDSTGKCNCKSIMVSRSRLRKKLVQLFETSSEELRNELREVLARALASKKPA